MDRAHFPKRPSWTGLEENIGSAKVDLTIHDLKEIEGGAAETQIEGERYPGHLMKTVGR